MPDAVVKYGWDNTDAKRGANEAIGLAQKVKAQTAAELSSIKSSLNFGAAIGTLGGLTAAGAGIKAMLNEYDDLADLSAKLNETPETLQRVGTVAKLSGTSVESLASAMLKLERNLGDAENDKAREALARYGFTAQGILALPLDEKLVAIAAAFQKARQDGTGLADMQDLLGKSSMELIPLLSMTGDELRGMFAGVSTLSNDAVLKMAALNDEVDLYFRNIKTGAAIAFVEVARLGQAIDAAIQQSLGAKPNALKDLGDSWKKSEKDTADRMAAMKAAREAQAKGAGGLLTKGNQAAEDKVERQKDARAMLAGQMGVLTLKSQGRDAEAAALQRQIDILKEAKQLKEQIGASDHEALQVAERLVDLQNQAKQKEKEGAKPEEKVNGRRKIHGYSREQFENDPRFDHRTFGEFFSKERSKRLTPEWQDFFHGAGKHMAKPGLSEEFNDFFHPGRAGARRQQHQEKAGADKLAVNGIDTLVTLQQRLVAAVERLESQ